MIVERSEGRGRTSSRRSLRCRPLAHGRVEIAALPAAGARR